MLVYLSLPFLFLYALGCGTFCCFSQQRPTSCSWPPPAIQRTQACRQRTWTSQVQWHVMLEGICEQFVWVRLRCAERNHHISVHLIPNMLNFMWILSVDQMVANNVTALSVTLTAVILPHPQTYSLPLLDKLNKAGCYFSLKTGCTVLFLTCVFLRCLHDWSGSR